MSDILVLQHVHSEPLGTISDALDSRGLSYRYVRSYDGEDIPSDLGSAVGLVVLGGPMGVYQEEDYPFLTEEKRLIEQALSRGVLVLGVCLGSQLLASVLGAEVAPASAPEIGWAPVTLSEDAAIDRLLHPVAQQGGGAARLDPVAQQGGGAALLDPVARREGCEARLNPGAREFMGFHWHGDAFDVPEGAVSLASSELTPCQAFRHGNNAYGFLFHMEVNDFMVRDWTVSFKPQLVKAGIDVDDVLNGIPQHLAEVQHIGHIVFGNWADLATRFK